MNAGAVRVKSYAPYCMVLKREFQDGLAHIAYWPGDSLVEFCDGNGGVDLALIAARISPRTHRQFMVTIERAPEITGDHEAWGSLINDGDRYFESAFLGAVTLAAVRCVRMEQSDYERLFSLSFESFGRKLEEAERALVHDFVQLSRAQKDGKIVIEVTE